MSLLSRHQPSSPPRREPPGHVIVARTPAPLPSAPAAPARQDAWDHAHLVLVAWKARSLLTEAASLVEHALVTTTCTDDGLVDELRAAVEATDATVARLRAAALAHADPGTAEGPDAATA